jgi:uncharacterized phiE125 gp8 family phage protein
MPTTAASYKVINQPTTLVVDLTVAKTHLFIFEDTTSDAQVEVYLATAQEMVEDYIGQTLTDTTWNATYPILDSSGLLLPHPNPTSITISYIDTNGTSNVVDANYYSLDESADVPRIFATNGSWGVTNSLSSTYTNPVTVAYNSYLKSYADTTAGPISRVQQAILLYLTDLWNNRANESAEQVSQITVSTAHRMLRKYRLPTL